MTDANMPQDQIRAMMAEALSRLRKANAERAR